MITADSNTNWLRASHVHEIMTQDKHYKGEGSVARLAALGAVFGMLGCAYMYPGSGLLELGMCGGAAGGAFCGEIIDERMQSPYIASQPQRDNYLIKKFIPYEIVRGSDLAYILEISSAEAQNKMLKKSHPIQLVNAIEKIKDERLKSLALSFLPPNGKFIDTTAGENLRFEKEALALNELAQNLNKTTSEKCSELFGAIYPEIANSFLTPRITLDNVTAMLIFAEENKLFALIQSCHECYTRFAVHLYFLNNESKKAV